jgi:hypothetical protein
MIVDRNRKPLYKRNMILSRPNPAAKPNLGFALLVLVVLARGAGAS